MMFFKKKNQNLKALAADYVLWQGRVEALEKERPGLHGRCLELQQAIMENKGDPQALQTAKAELADTDQRLEAGAAKLKDLWRKMEVAALADLEARYQAAPEIEAAFDREYQEKCEKAAGLFAQAMTLVEELAIDRAGLAEILGLVDRRFKASGRLIVNSVFSDAYSQAKRSALTPRDSEWANTYQQRRNDFNIFISNMKSADGRERMVCQEIISAIRAAGSEPPPLPGPYFGERERQYVGI